MTDDYDALGVTPHIHCAECHRVLDDRDENGPLPPLVGARWVPMPVIAPHPQTGQPTVVGMNWHQEPVPVCRECLAKIQDAEREALAQAEAQKAASKLIVPGRPHVL